MHPLDLAATLPVAISDTEAVYLYGLDIIAQQQAERQYYFHDGLGSVRQLLDSTGEVQTNYAYDPFGVPAVVGDASSPYRFTGEAWDEEVELLYLRARYYQPETGRFITKDPWAGDVWRPSTLNKYIYTANNSVNRADPEGLDDQRPDSATPTPTHDEKREQFELLQQQIEEGLEQRYGLPHAGCTVPVPTATAVPEMGDIYAPSDVEVTGALLRQHSVVSPVRSVKFFTITTSQEYGATSSDKRGRIIPLLVEVESSLTALVSTYQNGTRVDVWDTYDTGALVAVQQVLRFPPELHRPIAVMIPGLRYYEWPEAGLDFNEGVPPGQKGEGRIRAIWVNRSDGEPTGVLMYLWIPELGSLTFTFGWPWLGVASYTVPFYG